MNLPVKDALATLLLTPIAAIMAAIGVAPSPYKGMALIITIKAIYRDCRYIFRITSMYK